MDFPVCTFHYFEKPDYVSGVVYKINRFCVDVRKNKDLCGHEGKDFIQKEVVEEEDFIQKEVVKEEEPISFWEYLKGFFTKGWMF